MTLKSVVPPPTPWVTRQHPLTRDVYKFRLRLYRRGGALNLELAKDSETAARECRVVARSRLGYHEFIVAATALLNTTKWDSRTNPTYAGARTVWNERAIDYPSKGEHETTILLHLPQLLNPKRGRPMRPEIDAARALAQQTGGTSVSAVTAHARRRAEILLACSKVAVAFEPIRERARDARRMKGFTAEQVNEIARGVDHILQAADALRRRVQSNTIVGHKDQGPAVPAKGFVHVPASFATDFDASDLPLSPAEKAIAAEQARQDVPRLKVGVDDDDDWSDLDALAAARYPPKGFEFEPT